MITRDDRGGIAVLRLSHGKVSALDVPFCHAIADELDAIAAGDSRALVLTGTGSAFSAGVDLFQVLDGGADYLARFLPAMARLFETLLVFPRPAVAAINGHAIAGGCIMAGACDHRVMADGKSRIGIAELAVGVPFPPLPFEIMRGRVAPLAFRDLVFSGRVVTPEEARHVGFVDEVVSAETLLARAIESAERLARIPQVTFALTKRTFTAPILERVRASAPINDEVAAAWAMPEVQERVREYLAATIGKR